MRLYRFVSMVLRVGLPAIAAAALHGQVLVSLGTSTGCGNLQGGQTCTLTARVTGAANLAVTWSFSPAVSGASAGAGTAPDATGLSTNTYRAPSFITTRQVVTATATSVADPSKAASAQMTLVPIAVTIAVTPASVNLNAGQSQAFTATVSGISETGVTWSINPQVGAIDANGVYTAPSPIASTQKITVTATSTFDPAASGSASVNLQATAAVTVTVAPSTVTLNNNQSQQFTATVQNGAAGVVWSISPQVGSIDTNGLYTSPGLLTGSQKVTVTATSTADTSKTGTATVTLATVVDVGLGAPSNLIQQFVSAFYRNGFSLLVSLPPLGNVKKLGTTGYVQEFNDAAKTSGVKFALATISPTVPASEDGTVTPVVQLLGGVYGYYTSVGATTAGYPMMDTQICPYFDSANSCQYDLFDKGYALFAYTVALATGQNFTIRQAFYTEWAAVGGMTGPGRPVDVETAITALTTTTATVQTYAYGAIYSVTSGVNKGKTFGVVEPLYDLYVNQGGASGTLGLPTTEVLQVSTGVYRQTFEGGALQYTTGGGPTVQLPVAQVTLAGAQGNNVTLNLGQTLQLTAQPTTAGGVALTDRPVSWSTTNAKVISIQANGLTAVAKAVGGGAASVTASSQGVTSTKLTFTVIAPCCQIGAGAPASVQQAFQEAIARNKIPVQLPVQSAAARVGNGYVQMVQSNDPSASVVYMLAQWDQLGTAYVVAGTILTQYQTLGGPAGTLGYPTSDASAGGTQLFANSFALAARPVRVVSGGVLAKWALLGYETGAAGPPVSDAGEFFTFGANSGLVQSFRDGIIYAATEGPRAGQAYFVSGLILARHNALGGAAGDYGMPVGDETVSSALHQQNFEGGTITYSAGDAAAVEHPAPKVPGVVVAPQSVAAGGRARLAIMGFPNGSTVRVSVSGQTDFQVSTSNGAYSWEMAVPLTAKSGIVAIHAADSAGSAADGSLVIRGFSDNRIAIAKIQGDNQTGLPGALLPLSLRVALRDSSGTPVVGAPVNFQASPGTQLSTAATVTDASGQAETLVRLPAAEGVAAVTAEAPAIGQAPVSFYMRSAAATLANFPKLMEAGDSLLGNGSATIGRKGALVTAVASILRYHQNRGELQAPYGTADAEALNTFLISYCLYDAVKNTQLCDGFLSNPDSGEQIVNLWRATEFTGGLDIAVQNPTTLAIADLLAKGYPALLSLGLSLNGATAGGHYVVATGVAADGSIAIQDPNPLFARSNLNDYLAGFTVGGGTWKADLRGVVQFARRSPGGTRFMVAALSQTPDLMKNLALDVQSAAGACGLPVELLDTVDSLGNPAPLVSRIRVCDGLLPAYQIGVGAARRYRAFVTDLALGGTAQDVSGSAPATYKASRPQLALALEPQDVSFSADGVVNAATFTSGIAPGGILSIFGTGLSGSGVATTVEIDGAAVPILAATAFQINAVVPLTTSPGAHIVKVTSVYGAAQQPVLISAVAPAIFLVGSPAVGAVVNQNGTLNGPAYPLPRGQVLIIYATGLGTVTPQGQYFVTTTPVTVLLNGQELPVAYSGLAPGSTGEYQVNVVIPALTPPGLGVSLTLKQGVQLSNAVAVALQ